VARESWLVVRGSHSIPTITETGNWQLATGCWRLTTANWSLTTSH